ncbi:MAG: GYD domain-containing protein [Chloroflexi bacterium]|nr:GYD domain-containing protein [Chloroflexota bacterium]MBM3154657.1 GYD domain-containing protein [Chloroflexota bacterium]MBM3172591.1 GYD domain-containing protein [Chloroflexota bacterium]MBM3175749.1 GYD domain-containing protein [Chloroflexota bacterium]MBM4451042.1 GYD domain-containing protein [Chloroflexota bacterium]
MATYLMLTTLTGEGRKKIEEYPEWLRELNKEVEFMGVKILAQYGLLGQYDFVNIVEAPSDEVAAKLAIHLSARGGLQTLTLTAIPLDHLIKALKKKQEPL